jgi:Rrf2 family nitric oxide-sensitive transcriptional repressor
MLKLHKKVEYGLIALKYMQQKPAENLTTAKEISDLFHIPFDATARVLQLLSLADWLTSEQGAHGGYRLGKKSLKELSLFELIETIEGKQGVVKCVKEMEECPIQGTCNVITPMQRLNESLQSFLRTQRVTDLFDSTQSQGAW